MLVNDQKKNKFGWVFTVVIKAKNCYAKANDNKDQLNKTAEVRFVKLVIYVTSFSSILYISDTWFVVKTGYRGKVKKRERELGEKRIHIYSYNTIIKHW